jgi:hypothetical protein
MTPRSRCSGTFELTSDIAASIVAILDGQRPVASPEAGTLRRSLGGEGAHSSLL